MTQLLLTCRFFLEARNQPRLFDNIRPVSGLVRGLVCWRLRRKTMTNNGYSDIPISESTLSPIGLSLVAKSFPATHWLSPFGARLPWLLSRKVRIGPKDLESLDLTCIASVMRFFVYFFLIQLSSPLKIRRNRRCERGKTNSACREHFLAAGLLTGLRLNQLDLPHCAGKQRNESGCCGPSFRYAKCDNNSWIESMEYLWPKI